MSKFSNYEPFNECVFPWIWYSSNTRLPWHLCPCSPFLEKLELLLVSYWTLLLTNNLALARLFKLFKSTKLQITINFPTDDSLQIQTTLPKYKEFSWPGKLWTHTHKKFQYQTSAKDYLPSTCWAVNRFLGSCSNICLTRLFALSEICGQGSLLKSITPLNIAKATPCSVSTKRANKKANNFTIESNNYRHTHNSRTTKYLPKMEELHIAKYKESLQHSIYPLQAHNFASKPQAPYSTDSPQSPRTFHLRPTKPWISVNNQKPINKEAKWIHANTIPGRKNTDSPKSMALSGELSRLFANKKFSGFKSLWITPFSWHILTTSAIVRATPAAARSL